MTELLKIQTILISLFCIHLQGYPTYEGCPDLTDNDFRITTVVGQATNDPFMWEPIKLDFEPVYDGQGNMHVNLFWIQRGHRSEADHPGEVRFYDAQTGDVSIVGKLGEDFGSEVYLGDPTNENGLTGLALDRDFASNRYMYLYYSTLDTEGLRSDQNQEAFVVERYTVTAQNTVAPGSGKRLLAIPALPQHAGDAIAGAPCCHSGGAMAFDEFGDLWIGVGDQADYRTNNSEVDNYLGNFQSDTEKQYSGEWGTSNTHSLLGSILRIHPTDDDPRGYTIPGGNFAEHYAAEFPQRAAEFNDTSLVLPELYAKGVRNPYSMTLDPVRQWVTWGECGPDGPTTSDIAGDLHSGPTEEHNLRTEAGFMGWPYMSGPNIWHDIQHDPATPLNDSPFNDGMELLPPVEAPLYSYPRSCAMTGPIYRYDPGLDSDVKMPPHFHRQWLVTDHKQSWVRTLTVDEQGQNVTANEEIFDFVMGNAVRIVDFKVGPEGALYIVSYGHKHGTGPDAKLLKIEYTGDCLPTDVAWTHEKAGCMDPNFSEFDASYTHNNPAACKTPSGIKYRQPTAYDMVLEGRRLGIKMNGSYEINIVDLKGRHLYRFTGQGKQDFTIPEKINNNMFLVELRSGKFSYKQKIVLF